LARCSAYSDSSNDLPMLELAGHLSNDLPMLELVGHPNAVNPDAQLTLGARTSPRIRAHHISRVTTS
jgi:phosphoserine phosphatase